VDHDVRAALAALARRWVEAGWSRGDGALTDGALSDGNIVDALHAPDFVDHDSGGRSPDNQGFREGIVRLLAAFPDLRTEVRETVVETAADGAAARPNETCAGANPGLSGTVAVRWTAIGTHTGPYLGAAPTGRRIVFKGIEIVRVRDGLITERWGEWDGLDLIAQLGRAAP
jgi:predicted ester cyclase